MNTINPQQLFARFGINLRHPQTQEYMLTAPQALQILNCISQEHYAVVLGGDICDAHCRYLMPNWHYTPDDSFNRDENIQRSCEYARSFIQSLPYKHEVFFILVLSTDNL